MVKYRRLKSILLKDNVKYAVNLFDWSRKTLVGNELEQYKRDEAELTAYYKSQMSAGNLIVNDIMEEVTTNYGKILIHVGDEFTVSDTYIFPAKEIEWFNKMQADPNIIKFNDKEIIS
jgi:hypothetical protein